MNVSVWAAELARAFWVSAQEIEPFPRSLRRPIARTLPLAVILLPKLTIRALQKRLTEYGITCDLPGRDRPLQACLVARRGHGLAFVDGADSEVEQRFSLAHELAHFLREYWTPREQVTKRLGVAALEVLDGERPPTTTERLHAMLRATQLGFHVHLMERDNDGDSATAGIAAAEDDADRLAYELLAPADDVVGRGHATSRPALIEALCTVYGLPPRQAERYAALLAPVRQADPIFARLARRAR